MQINKNKVVSVHYTLHVHEGNASAEEFVEQTQASEPMVFLFGSGNLLPSFESQLEGLTIGSEFDFSLAPDQGYGEMLPDNVVKLPMEAFVAPGEELDQDMIAPGNFVPMIDNDGNQLQGLVLDVKPDHVVMDFNHPLAGKHLHFTGSISNVREANQDEIAHGHVHGAGGHHH